MLSIEDASGRESTRSVAEPDTAAVLIESWARSDPMVGLLAPPPNRAGSGVSADSGENRAAPFRGESSPGVGVGVGWMRSSVARSGMRTLDEDAGALRVEGHLALSTHLTSEIALVFGIGIDLSPVGRRTAFFEQGVRLAGEQGLYGRGSLGLRYGQDP